QMADWIRNLRDAGDILRRAKNPAELAKALVPNAWLARKVLNLDAPRSEGPIAASDAAEALRKLGNALKVEVIGEDGRVDYEKLQASETFAELERTSQLLHHVDPEQLTTDDARIAFWINVYNVLAIHGVLATGVRESVMEIPSFFGVVAYRVGDFVVTLDEIENGILRRNAPHPATKARLFDDDDPRLALCPDHVDARIHAALVCASTSCPPVAFYEAGRLDDQLDLAADNYVATDVRVDHEARAVRLPITFRYYESDFGRHAGVQLFLLNHATEEQKKSLQAAFDADYPFDYHRYDWSLNS
ncbi:MAG: DUF547 domain-containing protein, partial [Myxococcales bacterium]